MSEKAPTWEAEEFLSGTAPYEYLYSLRDNPFKQGQEKERLSRFASALGVKNFRTLWKGYLETMMAGRKAIKQANTTAFPDQEMELQCGDYECDEMGVTLYNQQYGEITVCTHPIMPVKRIVNLDTGECKTEIAFRRGGQWRKAPFEKKVLASAQRIIELASYGVAVDSENARQMVSYLSAIENANYDALPEVKSISRLGWVSGYGFSPYVENLMFDGNQQYKQAFDAVKTCGSYDVWKDEIKKLRAGKSVVARMMLAASFASVLIEPLHALPFMVHGWSNVSGIGKTVCLMACGSVWANPAQGEYLKNFNTTNVGIEMMAGFYGSMPLCLDELQLKDGKRDQFDSMIYQFCEGVGRTRGAKNGGLQRVQTWRNCAISTGEEPLTNSASKAGAINRVLDLNCGDIRMFDDPRETVRILMQNYGWAGPEFVKTLEEPKAIETIKTMQNAYSLLLEGKATDKQCLAASIILAADAWLDMRIFEDNRALKPDEILPFLQSTTATDVNKRAYEWLMDTVSANPSRFETREDGTYSGECWGTIDEAANKVYLIKSIFDRIMTENGYSTTGFLTWAKHKNLLETDVDKQRMTKKKRIKGLSAPARCVCISMEWAGESSDDFVAVQDDDMPF